MRAVAGSWYIEMLGVWWRSEMRVRGRFRRRMTAFRGNDFGDEGKKKELVDE